MGAKFIIIAVVAVVLVGGGVWFVMSSASDDVSLPLPYGDEVLDNGLIDPGPISGEIADVLARAQEVRSFKYELLGDGPDDSFVATFWHKGDNMRVEMTIEGGVDMIAIINQDMGVSYSYIPEQNMAIEMTAFESEEIIANSMKGVTASDFSEDSVVLGSEVINGKDSIIVNHPTDEGEVTFWIWKDYGLLLKVEAIVYGETIEIIVKNIEIIDIPDEMFELPAGVDLAQF